MLTIRTRSFECAISETCRTILLLYNGAMNNSKIIKLQNVTPELIETKKNRVLVGGCFDIFHFAHLDFLKMTFELNYSFDRMSLFVRLS